jgi:hypothetical protein
MPSTSAASRPASSAAAASPCSSVSLVPGQVDKAHTGWGFQAPVQALDLEDALEVADRVVEPDVLAVPQGDRQQSRLEQGGSWAPVMPLVSSRSCSVAPAWRSLSSTWNS